jgi:ubiquinone/menaquinone biosynthesis C-methylase UbiE
MLNAAEETVSKFYNSGGWDTVGEATVDAALFEDLRACAREYISKCKLRVLRYVPEKGDAILDMASGPIQYPEYVEYSRNFKQRYCVDLSFKALEEAKRKIGDHGVYLCGSFFDIALGKNFFDCAISLHTIYHIDNDRQEEAVRKLLEITKPGMPLIIVYSNPDALVRRFVLLFRKMTGFFFKKKTDSKKKKPLKKNLFFFAHPIKWWDRFSDSAEVQIVPFRSFNTPCQKMFIPDNKLGKRMLDMLFYLEDRFPNFFAKNFEYPIIVLKKKG